MIRRATIKDVAKLAAVSTVTVSRVVNAPDLVQTETRTRVQEAMRDLGYTPNIAARSMRTNLTRSIGFLTPELTSPTNAAVAQAAEQALAEAGYAMLVTSSDYSPSREIVALELLTTRRVDGIILYVSDETDLALIEAIGRLDVPLVLLDRELPIRADVVMTDHAGAIHEAVGLLASLGHERLALVQNDLAVRPSMQRRSAFEAALAAMPPITGEIVRISSMPLSTSSLPQDLLADPTAPTAVICDGVRLLRAVLDAARRCGRSVPEDLSIIAIDALEAASLTTPETTVIVRDFAAIGRMAVELMLARLADRGKDPLRIELESRLVRGGSCAPPTSGRTAPD